MEEEEEVEEEVEEEDVRHADSLVPR